MQNKRKTETQLVRELRALHAKMKRLEKSEGERRRLVDELRESEERYHLIVDNSDDAIFLTVPDGRILAANPAACKMFGHTEAEICRLGQNVIVDPTDPRLAEALNDGARTGRFKGELTLLRRGGQPFPAEVTTSVFRDRAGHQRTSVVIRDISKRKRAEEALDREENLLRALMDNIPDHIYFKDSASRFVRINKSLADTFGLSNPVQAIGRTDSDFFTEEHAQPAYEDEQGIVRTGQPLVGVEEKETWPDGRETWVSTTKMPLRDRAGQIIGTFGISRDITDRKQVEEALRGSEEKYKTLFAGAREAIFIAEAESGILLDCNEAACSLVERPKEELIGKHQSILHPTDELVGDFSDSFRRHVTTEGGVVLNARVVTKGGVFKDVEIKANVLDLRGEKIVQGFFSDITERKHAEEALAAERNLLSTMMNALPDRIYVKDIESRFMLNNLAHIRALGAQSQGDVIGKTDYDFRPPDLADRYLADDRRVVQSGQPLIGREEPTPLSTGERGWLSVNKVPLRDPEGKVIGLVGISRDITERKRAEEALRASEEKFRALFEGSKDIIYFSTAEGKLLDINAAGIELLGYASKQEMLQIDLTREGYADAEDKKRFDRLMDQQGFVKDFEVVLRRKDGGKLSVLETATAVRDNQGRIVQYRGIIRDITKQRQLERQFIQAQKMESIGTLAGGIAHDFNNILGIILGHVTMVERYKDTPAKLAHSVKTMTTAVERGTALVGQLLTFARKTQTLLESVRVNEVIEELIMLLRETCPTTIDISAQLDPRVPSIDGDPTQIQQVLLNLSVNARDAMPMGGSLTFTTRLVPGEELVKRFLGAHERLYVGISVRDTGIGMDEATKSHIFEPFFTTKQLGKGTGLGLSVVYGIVGAHRGFIEVESTLQGGSTFHVYLPASRTIHETFREKRAAAEEVRGGTETVLLVEDEGALRDLAKQALVEKGYRVIEASDGNQAVELYKAQWDQVDLVVSDMGLPKIGGYDLFLEMKSKNPHVKMVLASGYLEPELKLEILRSGVKDFIQKPYTRQALLKCVRDVLDVRG